MSTPYITPYRAISRYTRRHDCKMSNMTPYTTPSHSVYFNVYDPSSRHARRYTSKTPYSAPHATPYDAKHDSIPDRSQTYTTLYRRHVRSRLAYDPISRHLRCHTGKTSFTTPCWRDISHHFHPYTVPCKIPIHAINDLVHLSNHIRCHTGETPHDTLFTTPFTTTYHPTYDAIPIKHCLRRHI